MPSSEAAVEPWSAASAADARLVLLHIFEPAAAGGLEQVVRALAIAQHRFGHEVHVVAIARDSTALPGVCLALQEAGVVVHAVVVPSRAYVRERSAVRELCRGVRPDVVHIHGVRADVLLAPVVRRLGIPTVSTAHGRTGDDWKWRLFERLQDASLRRADAVIAVSRSLARLLGERGVPSERLAVIRNAYAGASATLARQAAREALGVAPDQFHIGWVGRLSHEKGPDVLLEALRLVDGRSLQVSIIGDGRDREALRSLAARCGLGGIVRWTGVVPDAARLFSAFDLFLLTSRTEGTPIVLLEAIAARVPVVATAVGGVPEVVSETEALLVPSESPAAMARAIERVRRDPDDAARRVEAAARRLARDFSPEPWLAAHDALYRSILRRRRAP